MPVQHPKFVAAAAQLASVMHDVDGCVEKAIAMIDEAGRCGVDLIAFPEAWAPGYPYWAWLGSPAYTMRFVQEYHNNSLERDGAEMALLCDAAKRNQIHVVFGYSERVGGTLYLAQSLIDASGDVIAHRRKLRPTSLERGVFGDADGSNLAVHDTALGRLGALCCWEHLQPLTKFAMYSMHEQVHVASWPTLFRGEGTAYALGPEANMAASQVYALEGQCFVIASTSVMTDDIRDVLALTEEQRATLPLGGGHSAIFAPDGSPIGNRLAEDEEGLVIAEIDLNLISLAKVMADPSGHYARPDVTRLLFNNQPSPPVEMMHAGSDEFGVLGADEPFVDSADFKADI